MDVFDHQLNEHLESSEQKSECMECGIDVQLGKQYCCFGCFDSSNR